MVGEKQSSIWPREPGKDQAGNEGDGEDPGEEFDRGYEMSIMGLGVHVAVTGGRKRLDAEVEIIDISPVGHVRDRLISDPVEHREDRVEGDKYQCGSADKGRP